MIRRANDVQRQLMLNEAPPDEANLLIITKRGIKINGGIYMVNYKLGYL